MAGGALPAGAHDEGARRDPRGRAAPLLLAAAPPRAPRRRRSFSRRGASSRWRRFRTSTSSSTSAIASPASLAFTDGAGNPVHLESLLEPRQAGAGDAGYHRCPMLCGLVLDGLVKAAARVRPQARQGLLRRRRQHRPRRGRQAARPDAEARAHAGRAAATPPTGRSGRRSATAARRRASSPTRSASATSTTRASKQFAHDAVAFVLTPEAWSPATCTAWTTRPATSAWRSSRRAAAASARRSTRC